MAGERRVTLWGGRFDRMPSEGTWSFTRDTSDRRLLEVDVEGSIAHARMLGKTGVIPHEDANQIVDGLTEILTEAREGQFVFETGDEDVHSAVERRLQELTGEVAGKLHTGRSRNDQVALDLRLYLRRSCEVQVSELEELVERTIRHLAAARKAGQARCAAG